MSRIAGNARPRRREPPPFRRLAPAAAGTVVAMSDPMQLRTCTSCDGLVPAPAERCPHCDAAAPPPRGRGARLARHLLGLVAGTGAALTLMACYGAPGAYDRCYDHDGDGYFPACYQPTCAPDDIYCDCNDSTAAVHPGAPDPFGDGVDTDCDGADGMRPGWPDGGVPDAGPAPDAYPGDDAAPPPDAEPGADGQPADATAPA
jgi:Putative metal-binding motif